MRAWPPPGCRDDGDVRRAGRAGGAPQATTVIAQEDQEHGADRHRMPGIRDCRPSRLVLPQQPRVRPALDCECDRRHRIRHAASSTLPVQVALEAADAPRSGRTAADGAEPLAASQGRAQPRLLRAHDSAQLWPADLRTWLPAIGWRRVQHGATISKDSDNLRRLHQRRRHGARGTDRLRQRCSGGPVVSAGKHLLVSWPPFGRLSRGHCR